MAIYLILFIWWIVGVAACFVTVRAIDPAITVGDALAILFFGTLGPIAIIFYFMYAQRPNWLDKRIL